MKNFTHLAARVLNTPLLLEPGYARTFFSALSGRLGIAELYDNQGAIGAGQKLQLNIGKPSPVAMSDDDWTDARREEQAYKKVAGVAILPVSGTLVHKHGYLNPYSGMTGYDGIVRRLSIALADPDVKGVLLDMDTPGGEVAGCFDAAQKIRQMAAASGKPLWALCYDMNCSAGMAIASAADRRIITQTGIAGSVGVLMAHCSFEKYLQDEGIKVTLVHSGARKVDGNPYQDLPDEVLKRFTGETDSLRQDFATLVSSMIGIDLAAVLQTEAETYRGQAAVDIGFADEVVNGNDAVDIFIDHLSSVGRTTDIGGNSMSTSTQKPGATAQAEATTTDQPAAQVESDKPKEFVSGAPVDNSGLVASGERARVSKILSSDEAKGRATLANHLALNTALDADAAIAVLASATPETPGAKTPLDTAMSNTEQPNIGLGVQSDSNDSQAQIDAIAGDYACATGKRLATK